MNLNWFITTQNNISAFYKNYYRGAYFICFRVVSFVKWKLLDSGLMIKLWKFRGGKIIVPWMRKQKNMLTAGRPFQKLYSLALNNYQQAKSVLLANWSSSIRISFSLLNKPHTSADQLILPNFTLGNSISRRTNRSCDFCPEAAKMGDC